MKHSEGVEIHPGSLVASTQVGSGTRIWAFVNILQEAEIGKDCNICDHCFIENKVKIGNRVTLKSGVFLWDGITLEDDVFVGPNVVFTNDLYPRSKHYKEAIPTLVQHGASLGANATIRAGVHIGRYAMIGMASVVTKDVPDYALVYGNPARFQGWVDEQGQKLIPVSDGLWANEQGKHYQELNGQLKPLR